MSQWVLARWAWLRAKVPWLRFDSLDPVLLFLLLVDGFLLLHRLAEPENSLIFDEAYYVNDSRVILGRPVGKDNLPETFLSGCDPNSEHPPLAKLIMVAGMTFFSDSPYGWRLPSVALGLLSVWMVYVIVRRLKGSQGQARFAALALASDNLFFVHSRIATLDIYMVGFMLIGVALYLCKRYEFAGIALGLSTLCKVNGLLGVASLFLFEVGRRYRPRQLEAEEVSEPHSWLPFGLMLGFYLVFSYTALGLMDCLYTEFSAPIYHIQHIFKFGTNLVREAGIAPQGLESTPLQWWLNEKTINYFELSSIVNGNTNPSVVFLGKMNLYLIAAFPFALVYCARAGWRGNWLGLLAVCMFIGNYCPMLLTWMKTRRICYIYYMVPDLPWMAIALSCALRELPGWVRWVFAFASFYAFYATFPFKV